MEMSPLSDEKGRTRPRQQHFKAGGSNSMATSFDVSSTEKVSRGKKRPFGDKSMRPRDCSEKGKKYLQSNLYMLFLNISRLNQP